MVLSQRTVRLLALTAWSACLVLLWLSGEVDRYLGPRTAWIVPVGGIGLTLATVAYAALSAGGPAARTGVGRAEGLGIVALGLPVLVVFTMANASLGSLAASRKLSTRGLDLTQLVGDQAAGKGQTSLVSLNVAEQHPGLAAKYGAAPGALVRLQGFVYRPTHGAGGSFRLARMYITCCVADAIALTADVRPAVKGPALAKDAWVEVDGTVEGRGHDLTVRAARVTAIAKPRHPYLSFVG